VKGIDPNDWRYVLNKTHAVVNVPKATFKGVRNGPRDYIFATAYANTIRSIKGAHVFVKAA
jgi:hypothetical protein